MISGATPRTLARTESDRSRCRSEFRSAGRLALGFRADGEDAALSGRRRRARARRLWRVRRRFEFDDRVEHVDADFFHRRPRPTRRRPRRPTAPRPQSGAVELYFTRGEQFAPVERDEIPAGDNGARLAAEALFAGPSAAEAKGAKGARTTIPEGTELEDFEVNDGVATVTASAEFLDGIPAAAAATATTPTSRRSTRGSASSRTR